MLKNNLRILFLTQTHNLWGGIESWFDALTLWLQRKDWNVHVGLAKGARFNDPSAFLQAHPTILNPIIMEASVGTEEARIQAIMDACLSSSPDLVVPVALGAVFPAIRRLKLRGNHLRLIIPIHSMQQGYLQNVIDNIDVIDKAVGVSRLIEQFLLTQLPHKSSRIHYLRNGVSVPLMQSNRFHEVLRIGVVGRLENHCKRILDLIPLVNLLNSVNVLAEVHVYGQGPEENFLKTQLSDAQSGTCRVTFHGYAPHRELYLDVFPNLDVLLLFSISEGSPLVLYEAMHHGVVPVVSHFLGSACEGAIRHNQNALTFPIGDMKMAAEHLTRLGYDSNLREKLSCQAKIAAQPYSLEGMCERWERLFRDAFDMAPCLPVSGGRDNLKLPPVGRLERLGLPPRVSNAIRKALKKNFPHKCGFEEWPGSQPIQQSTVEAIDKCLYTIEEEARAFL